MQVGYTVQDLIDFEREVADLFSQRKIPHPVHLSGGNEAQLIEVFERHVGPDDWICCTWRSHLHCLLKGVPREKVLDSVVAGHSIAMCFPEHRVISSAIVGGMAPIAVGLAMGIKRRRENNRRRVVCFVGDMAWRSGVVREAVAYSRGWELPVTWIVEDNGVSTGTPTVKVWGVGEGHGVKYVPYLYSNKYPHCGIGRHVQF